MLHPEQIERIVAERGPWLYHVTEAGRWDAAEPSLGEQVQEHGLHGTDSYHPKTTVYLSWGAPWLGSGHDAGDAVFRVDIRKLDPALIEADEWQIMKMDHHPLLYAYGGVGEGVSDEMAAYLADPAVVEQSLLDQAALPAPAISYRGSISADLIERIEWAPKVGTPRPQLSQDLTPPSPSTASQSPSPPK